MEIHQNADFRHSLEVQKFSEMDKTSGTSSKKFIKTHCIFLDIKY